MPDYFTNIGPTAGPIRHDEIEFGHRGDGRTRFHRPIGEAFRAGRIADGLAVFQLRVDKVELSGLYICIGRRFVPLGDAAEVLSGRGTHRDHGNQAVPHPRLGPRRWAGDEWAEDRPGAGARVELACE